MPLNDSDQLSVVEGPVMTHRVRASIIKYAVYLRGLGDTATDAQRTWARNATADPDQYVRPVARYFTGNQVFIDNGSSVIDGDVEFIVQTTINNHYIIEPEGA